MFVTHAETRHRVRRVAEGGVTGTCLAEQAGPRQLQHPETVHGYKRFNSFNFQGI